MPETTVREPTALDTCADEAFVTHDGLCAMFRPIGRNKARELIAADPRAPKPILGEFGSRRIYSKAAATVFRDLVAKTGFATTASTTNRGRRA